MPNKHTTDGNYRYAFQGQEKDPETEMEAFELRLWDGRLGRWLTVDPYHEFHSPYVGMGNNPISLIDPDGGSTEGGGEPPGFFRRLWNKITGNTESEYQEIPKIKDDDIAYSIELREITFVKENTSVSKINAIDLDFVSRPPLMNFPIAPRYHDDYWWNKLAYDGSRRAEYNGFIYVVDHGGFPVKYVGSEPQGGTMPVGPSGNTSFLKNLKPKELYKLGKKLKNIIQKGRAPKGVDRVDIPKLDPTGNPLHNQKVHIHLKDGRALNLDGTWKHGEGEVSKNITDWIKSFMD